MNVYLLSLPCPLARGEHEAQEGVVVFPCSKECSGSIAVDGL